ncbi:MAG: hypothetical protein HUU45_15670 [Leptospiraceae bacterium]|nr:hypothetical protein [Leptospiraceae bacterium]
MGHFCNMLYENSSVNPNEKWDIFIQNLQEVHRVLKYNGRYIVVVGNNNIRGEIFQSWRYLMDMAELIGFKIENYFGSEIIKHFIKVPRNERINTDWIIVLRK